MKEENPKYKYFKTSIVFNKNSPLPICRVIGDHRAVQCPEMIIKECAEGEAYDYKEIFREDDSKNKPSVRGRAAYQKERIIMQDQGQGDTPSGETISAYEGEGHALRADILAIAIRVKKYRKLSAETTPTRDDSFLQNSSEMVANSVIAYRHLEDARMRIGKCMQAYQGGVSILDKMRECDGVTVE